MNRGKRAGGSTKWHARGRPVNDPSGGAPGRTGAAGRTASRVLDPAPRLRRAPQRVRRGEARRSPVIAPTDQLRGVWGAKGPEPKTVAGCEAILSKWLIGKSDPLHPERHCRFHRVLGCSAVRRAGRRNDEPLVHPMGSGRPGEDVPDRDESPCRRAGGSPGSDGGHSRGVEQPPELRHQQSCGNGLLGRKAADRFGVLTAWASVSAETTAALRVRGATTGNSANRIQSTPRAARYHERDRPGRPLRIDVTSAASAASLRGWPDECDEPVGRRRIRRLWR